ncbi:metallophosphoesterase [Kordiimonas sp.]|uniref:metallophosphoesterase n=1 Tax=Kordiimonas sp. TaxID=1970157 RepID=UPI003B516BEC
MRKLPTYIHPSHKVLRRTGHGRTFVCGGLHGCYDELMCELSAVAFDHNKDTLIGLGDLTDRGTRCYECIKLLSEPWFTSILGNHDEMMLNAVNARSDKSFWRANGGGWFDQLSFAEQEEVQFICEQYVEHLPLSMTLILPDGAQVGLIHADTPNNWREAIELGNSLKELQGNIALQQQADSMVKRPDILFDPLGEYPMGDNA